MCLGIPGKVVETFVEGDMPMGKVDFGGVFKNVCLAHTPQVEPGEYVIVHVGFALQVIDAKEAQRIFSLLDEMDELDELRTPTRDVTHGGSL